jgi:hypothetical protein
VRTDLDNILELIERIIEEHKIILADFETLEKVFNDAGALILLSKSGDAFMPGRPSPTEGLKKLDESRNKVAVGLEAHFNREETVLLKAFESYGEEEHVTALKNLLKAHIEIRSELSILKGDVAELLTEKVSRNLWEAKGYEVKARINQVHKTMAGHASEEQVLLNKVRKDVKNSKK